ncbi:MAG: hypothetical protein AAF320_03080, partial [Myxococcota bacterium]
TTGLSALELQSPARAWFHQVLRTFKRNLSLCGVFQLQETPRAINFATLHFQKNQDGKLQVNMTVQSNMGSPARNAWRFTYTLTQANSKHTGRVLASLVHEHFTGDPGSFLNPIVAVKKIVDRKTGKPFSQLVLLAMDGSLLQVLTKGSFDNVLPSFSPDGCSLFYTSYERNNPDLVRMDLRTKQRFVIFKQPGMSMGASCFPSGDIAFTHSPVGGKSNLYRLGMPFSNVLPKPFFNPLALGLNTSIHVHPQGKSILFVSDRLGSPRIYAMDADGSNARRVVAEGTFQLSPRFIPPHGKRFLFVARDQQSKQMDIFVARLPQGQEAQKNRFATLMPALTQNQGDNLEPYPSPDGRLITFISTRIKGKQEIYVSTMDGNYQRRITSNGPYFTPVWGSLCKE